jgi:Tfp pilus assembly protein PilF
MSLPVILVAGCLAGRGPAGRAGNAALLARAPLPVLLQAGEAYLKQGEPNDAFIVFRRAVARDAKSYEAQLGLAQAAAELGEAQSGATAAAAAATLKPQEAAPLIAAGRIALASGQLSNAEGYYQDAIKRDARNAEAWRALGEVRLGEARAGQGSLNEALAALEKAGELDPKSALIQGQLGAIYAAAGRYGNATEAYTRAVALDPKNASYPKNLAWLLIDQKRNLARARELAQKSDQLERGDGDALLAAAVALLRQGQAEEAINELQEAIQKSGSNADLYVFLAQACVQRGRPQDYETALKALEYVRAMGLAPRRAPQEEINELVEAIKAGFRQYAASGS